MKHSASGMVARQGDDTPRAPRARPTTSPRAVALHVAVLLVAAAGVVALWNDLATTWRIVMAVIVTTVAGIRLLPLTRWFGRRGTIIEYIGAAIGLIVIPVFALLGIDALLAHLGTDPFSPAARLVIGFVIVLFVARVSLEPFWTDHELPHPWVLATGATLLLTVVPGLVIALIGQINGDGRTLDQRATVSRLDVIVLRSDPAPPTPPTTHLGSWRIDTWTAQVDGDRIAWAGGRQPQLSDEADTDRVLILLPPAADNAAPARWMALADRVEPRATSTYALLDHPDDRQLAAWRAPLSGPTGRAGDALALTALPADASTPEPRLGLLAATQSPAAAADLALAVAHRPILRFDTHEPAPRPLDVDALFGTGDISMCEGGQKIRQRCVQLHNADELQTGFNHLAFDTHALATAKVPSRIYVHVTHTLPQPASADGLIDLDYWWYLPDNPAHSGNGAFCGPGFSIGGVTCFDHQSDWEGVTVVLDARDAAGAPVAVNYAQHDGSVRYTWAALERLWELTRAQRLAPSGALDTRPLVFSARGTHASYPVACGDVSCPRNVVPEAPQLRRPAGQSARRPEAMGGHHRRGVRRHLRRRAADPPRRRRARGLERLAGRVGDRQLPHRPLLRVRRPAALAGPPAPLREPVVHQRRVRRAQRPVHSSSRPGLHRAARLRRRPEPRQSPPGPG